MAEPQAPKRKRRPRRTPEQIAAEAELKAARAKESQRKARNGRLVQHGIVVERLLEEGKLNPGAFAKACKRHLKGRSLARALTGPLEPYADD